MRGAAGDGRGTRRGGDGLGGAAARSGEFAVSGCARPLGNRAGGVQQGDAAGGAREGRAGARASLWWRWKGKVTLRGKANPELATGEVEIVATRLHILNNAKTPPFPIEDEINAAEETRLRYPLSGFAAAEAAPQPGAAAQNSAGNPEDDGRDGIHRGGNADADALHSGGRARLPGAEPRASRDSFTRCRNRRRFSSRF